MAMVTIRVTTVSNEDAYAVGDELISHLELIQTHGDTIEVLSADMEVRENAQ